jgi:hypothetical protein
LTPVRGRRSTFHLELERTYLIVNELRPGRYQHYKGNFYTVLGVARHSETDEELVVYRPEYGERGLWVRPKAMFLESVVVNGQSVPRFRFVRDDSTTVSR